MPNLASQFAAGVEQAMALLGAPAVYICGDTGANLALQVALATPDYEVAAASGISLSAETWEALIETSALVFAGQERDPVAGDSILVSSGGTDTTYSVLNPDGARYCWSWADRFHIRRRLYVKVTGQAPMSV